MIANRGTLKAFQDGCNTDLVAQAYFAPVGIIVADDGDLETLIERATAAINEKGGKMGAWIVIGQVTGTVESREIQREVVQEDDSVKLYKPYINAELWIACSESLLENRDPDSGTGIPALTLAEAVMQTLHRPVSSTHPLPRYTNGPFPIAPETKPDKQPDTSKIGYLVSVRTEGWATALDAAPITLEP